MDMYQDDTWPIPPPELTAFLRGIKLEKLDTKLEELGYDDVDVVLLACEKCASRAPRCAIGGGSPRRVYQAEDEGGRVVKPEA